jgi:hypothetical protein
VRRFADVVRQLVHTMRLTGFGGYETIAQTLARTGWRISKTTVARILKEKPPQREPGEPNETEARPVHNKGPLRARFPKHIFLADLTDIPSLFGIFRFKLALVFDVFSRMPLAARVFFQEPTASEIATPAEIYYGDKPAHLSALPPPRGRPGEGPTKPPFRIEHLDRERRLPYLVNAA